MFAAIDAGGRNAVAWATSISRQGTNLEELGALIRKQLSRGRVVLAVEAPLWVPLRSQHWQMTRARSGERLSWAGRVGSGALGCGLANLAVVLRHANPARIIFDDSSKVGHLVVLEAYRESAGADHSEVAKHIVVALRKGWPDGFDNKVTRSRGEPVMNLVAAMALALRISVSPSDLRRETRVIDPNSLK
jgi:hypothetical protein